MILCDDDGPNYFSSEEVDADGMASGYSPSPRVEGRDRAAVSSVASVIGPSEGVACSDGAVVSSVASVIGVVCNDGAVVDSATSVVEPSEGVGGRAERRRGVSRWSSG